MQVQSLDIADVKLVVTDRHADARGFFSETYNRRALAEAGIAVDFVQDNHALSVEVGVVRGLHFQAPPHGQDKLLRVTRGAIFDVAVDIRSGSATYGRHVGITLSAENWHQLWIPKGFAHGYCTLEPHTEVIYKVSDYYAPESEKGVLWSDPALSIEWPVASEKAILSPKDREYPPLAALPAYF